MPPRRGLAAGRRTGYKDAAPDGACGRLSAMTTPEIWKTAAAILTALGGGGAIVAAFSSWLGKLWAEKLMAKEKAKYEEDLAKLKSQLERSNQDSLVRLQTDLGIFKDTYLKQHNDKIGTYGYVFNVVAEFLADLDMIRLGKKPDGDAYDRFNRGRLKAHGYLAMLATQKVMDAWDSFTDHIFTTLEKNQTNNYHEDWKEMRRRAYVLINAIREDIGIDKSPVEYRGRR